MNQREDISSNTVPAKSRSGRRWLIAAVIASALGVVSVAGVSFAKDNSDGSGHHGWHPHHEMSAESISAHVDKFVNHILEDGTAEQKTRVTAIANAAVKDLLPLRAQHHAAHQQVMALLTQTNIDRPALEQLRVDELRLVDQVSKRITQAVADAAEVLTPAQRLKLAEHMKQRMGDMHG